MITEALPSIAHWLSFFDQKTLPILRVTAKHIESIQAALAGVDATNIVDYVDARDIAKIVLQDPMMTVRVLSFIQGKRSHTLQTDIRTTASAIIMAGLPPFFKHFQELPSIEQTLQEASPQALLYVLKIIRRAQRAADYAQDWAIRRHDLNLEEIRTAALLHDLAEILVGCFAPTLLLDINRQVPGVRSAIAQKNTLGFTYNDLQHALNEQWHLPELLKALMDDNQESNPRTQNVVLSVQLARHSANGWNDPALPDDFIAIGKLLNLSPDATRRHIVPPDILKQ